MGAKTFFKKVGRGLQSGTGQFTNAAARGAGQVLGSAAAKYALEAAPLLMMKTGGYVKGPRNKAVPAILHGGETILPFGVKPTKKQKAVIASNKRKSKAGKFV
jgi:hypothetical protein